MLQLTDHIFPKAEHCHLVKFRVLLRHLQSLHGKTHAIPGSACWLHESWELSHIYLRRARKHGQVCPMQGIRNTDKYPLGLPGSLHLQHTLETCEHDKGRTNVSVNCTEKPPTSVLRLIKLRAQVQMQTIPAAPLLTPLSVQSSPSSSFFLDQTIDAAEKQSRKAFKLRDIPSLSRLDDGDNEVNDGCVDEERPIEKSHWSDDSDIDEDEDEDDVDEDQPDKEDDSGQSVTSKTDVVAKDEEADEEALKLKGKGGIASAFVLEEAEDEMIELNDNTHTGNARRLSRVSRKPVPRPSIHDDMRE